MPHSKLSTPLRINNIRNNILIQFRSMGGEKLIIFAQVTINDQLGTNIRMHLEGCDSGSVCGAHVVQSTVRGYVPTPWTR